MDVLLVVPNTIGVYPKAPGPHIGISYISAILEKYGHDVRVIDMRVNKSLKDLQKKLTAFPPELVGITSASYEHKVAYKLIEEIKKMGNYQVVIGGPHASTIRGQILEETKADFAITREGEYSMLELCAGKDHKDIKGLIWKKGDGSIVENEDRSFITDLDELPFPAYEKFELNKYLEKEKIRIVSSRGCPGACIFCSIGITMGKRFRGRSAENVIEEMEYWYKKGYRHFQFTDDCFSFDLDRAKRICDLIIDKRMEIAWDLRNGIRADKVEEELLQKMKKSGCEFIAFGIESSNEEVLRNIRKNITVNQVEQAVKTAHKLGIQTSGFFMIGNPGDTFKRFEESLSFARALPLSEIRFYNTIPYPRTKLYEWVTKNARWRHPSEEYLNNIDSWHDEPVFETDDFSALERRKAFKIAQSEVMKYFLKKELGKLLGVFAYLIWANSVTRRIAMKPGLKLWELLRAKKG